MTISDVYALAHKNRCSIERASLPECRSLSVEVLDKKYIGIDETAGECEEIVMIAHEVGHHAYAGLYTENTPLITIGRIEHRARKWSYLRLLPPGKLKEALSDPFCQTPDEIAERFNVTPEFVVEAMIYYRDCAGF